MLDGTGNDVTGRIAGQAKEGEVVRLGGAAGEDDLIGLSAEQGGGSLAGVLQGLASAAADTMSAGGIAEGVGEIGAHRLPDGGQRRRGGVVVEINGVHAVILPAVVRGVA